MLREILQDENVAVDAAFKSQSKSTDGQTIKAIEKKFKSKCHKCGKIGHLKRDCRSKSEKLNKLDSQKGTKESKDVESEKGLSASSAFVLNNEECRIIADSGASVHLTSNIGWFSSFRKVVPPLVLNIADGNILKATHVGNIKIEKSTDESTVEDGRNEYGNLSTTVRV